MKEKVRGGNLEPKYPPQPKVGNTVGSFLASSIISDFIVFLPRIVRNARLASNRVHTCSRE